MTALESAVVEISDVLSRLKLPHMLIGGMALALLAEPRVTLDVDVSVWPAKGVAAAVRGICSEMECRLPDPERFAEHTRVLPLVSRTATRVDVLLAAFPFEKHMIERARSRTIGGSTVPVATAEDLLLLKAVSNRTRDAQDVQQLLKKLKSTLDREYLQKQLVELAKALDRTDLLEILQRF
jgi:hypothetical protein